MPRIFQPPKLPENLNKPIKMASYPPSSLLFQEEQKKMIQKANEINFAAAIEFEKKLDQLGKYYTLDKNDPKYWEHMTRKIVGDFLPGFQFHITQKKGRKEVWSDETLYILWAEVEQNKQKTGQSASSVCRSLSKKEPWANLIKTTTKGDKNPITLYQHYDRSLKSPLVTLLQSMVASFSGKDQGQYLYHHYEILCRLHFPDCKRYQSVSQKVSMK
jgi:hypothetical protein